MRDGIVFKVDREIGAGTFVVNAYRFGAFCGTLRGHLDNRSGVIRHKPGVRVEPDHAGLVPGVFHASDFPIALRFCEIPYERRERA